ncbi:hypothetical protein [Thermus brockianus]|uniref:hypothetical protein n=1 Tax=Thermus brockianus TaxID=56956 RepID=UPI001FCB7435|nr:hypothetical protein [Thermus brockianus]
MVIVAAHKESAVGTLRIIPRQAGLTRGEFEELGLGLLVLKKALHPVGLLRELAQAPNHPGEGLEGRPR